MQATELKALIDEFLAHKQGSGRVESEQTIIWYRKRLKRFVSFVERLAVDDLSASVFEQYAADMKADSLSVAYRNGCLKALKVFAAWLHQQEYTAEDLSKTIDCPKMPRYPKPKFISKENMYKIIAAARSLRDRALLLFLRDTGCRLGELLGLHWADVDIEGKQAVVTGKGNKTRTVFFTGATRQAISAYRETVPHADTDPVWWGKRNGDEMPRPLSHWAINRILARLASRAGVTGKWNPHSWRHAFGRDMTRSGCPTRMLQGLMGHADIQVTMLYAFLDDKDLQEGYYKYVPYGYEEEDEHGR